MKGKNSPEEKSGAENLKEARRKVRTAKRGGKFPSPGNKKEDFLANRMKGLKRMPERKQGGDASAHKQPEIPEGARTEIAMLKNTYRSALSKMEGADEASARGEAQVTIDRIEGKLAELAEKHGLDKTEIFAELKGTTPEDLKRAGTKKLDALKADLVRHELELYRDPSVQERFFEFEHNARKIIEDHGLPLDHLAPFSEKASLAKASADTEKSLADIEAVRKYEKRILELKQLKGSRGWETPENAPLLAQAEKEAKAVLMRLPGMIRIKAAGSLGYLLDDKYEKPPSVVPKERRGPNYVEGKDELYAGEPPETAMGKIKRWKNRILAILALGGAAASVPLIMHNSEEKKDQKKGAVVRYEDNVSDSLTKMIEKADIDAFMKAHTKREAEAKKTIQKKADAAPAIKIAEPKPAADTLSTPAVSADTLVQKEDSSLATQIPRLDIAALQEIKMDARRTMMAPEAVALDSATFIPKITDTIETAEPVAVSQKKIIQKDTVAKMIPQAMESFDAIPEKMPTAAEVATPKILNETITPKKKIIRRDTIGITKPIEVQQTPVEKREAATPEKVAVPNIFEPKIDTDIRQGDSAVSIEDAPLNDLKKLETKSTKAEIPRPVKVDSIKNTGPLMTRIRELDSVEKYRNADKPKLPPEAELAPGASFPTGPAVVAKERTPLPPTNMEEENLDPRKGKMTIEYRDDSGKVVPRESVESEAMKIPRLFRKKKTGNDSLQEAGPVATDSLIAPTIPVSAKNDSVERAPVRDTIVTRIQDENGKPATVITMGGPVRLPGGPIVIPDTPALSPSRPEMDTISKPRPTDPRIISMIERGIDSTKPWDWSIMEPSPGYTLQPIETPKLRDLYWDRFLIKDPEVIKVGEYVIPHFLWERMDPSAWEALSATPGALQVYLENTKRPGLHDPYTIQIWNGDTGMEYMIDKKNMLVSAQKRERAEEALYGRFSVAMSGDTGSRNFSVNGADLAKYEKLSLAQKHLLEIVATKTGKEGFITYSIDGRQNPDSTVKKFDLRTSEFKNMRPEEIQKEIQAAIDFIRETQPVTERLELIEKYSESGPITNQTWWKREYPTRPVGTPKVAGIEEARPQKILFRKKTRTAQNAATSKGGNNSGNKKKIRKEEPRDSVLYTEY